MCIYISGKVTPEVKASPWVIPGLDISPTPEQVFDSVCRLTGAKPADIRSKSRRREHATVRQVYCYMAKEKTKATLQEIGNVAGIDHTTVIHSCRRVRESIAANDWVVMPVYEKAKKYFDEFHVRNGENVSNSRKLSVT
jgi:hypothetical protein